MFMNHAKFHASHAKSHGSLFWFCYPSDLGCIPSDLDLLAGVINDLTWHYQA